MANRFYADFDVECLPRDRTDGDHRTPFQVDRDRIVYTPAFRRLQAKTQVFQSGEFDFYRTRLTHSIEVARIGRSICEYLNGSSSQLKVDFYIDPDLVEAAGLAHDLGHPPFGHIGERKLNELMAEFGGFEGNAQTLRMITELIFEQEMKSIGMCPTRAFLDSILKYKVLRSEAAAGHGGAEKPKRNPRNRFLYDDQEQYRAFALGSGGGATPLPSPTELNGLRSIECQIMDWADDTAYSLHDILDGMQAGFISTGLLHKWTEQNACSGEELALVAGIVEAYGEGFLQARFGSKVGSFIRACRLSSREGFLADRTNRYRFALEIDACTLRECGLYKRIAADLIFSSPSIQQIEFKGGHVLDRLFAAFSTQSERPGDLRLNILPPGFARKVEQSHSSRKRMRIICDFLASMTDGLAIRTYKRLYDPDFGSILDLV